MIRILRGDRAARDRLVAMLAAGPIPRPRARGSSASPRLVDAIAARAIEDGYLDLPGGRPLLGPVHVRRARARSSARCRRSGYRFDGLGGFADERVPAQRDLSLAVGYAGPRPDADPDVAARARDPHALRACERSPRTSGWRRRPTTCRSAGWSTRSAPAPRTSPRSGTPGAASGPRCSRGLSPPRRPSGLSARTGPGLVGVRGPSSARRPR